MNVAKERTSGALRTFIFLKVIRRFSSFSREIRPNPLEET